MIRTNRGMSNWTGLGLEINSDQVLPGTITKESWCTIPALASSFLFSAYPLELNPQHSEASNKHLQTQRLLGVSSWVRLFGWGQGTVSFLSLISSRNKNKL